MPGYGGILSGLVQGYGSAVIGKEKRDYEEKQKKQQQELQMYQMILENPDADPATKQAAFGKIEETIHGGGNGKKSQGPGLLSKIGGLLSGHMGDQTQPVTPQVAPGQSPPQQAQPVNPQAAVPSPGGQAPVSTTPVVRPELTPPPQKTGAVSQYQSAAQPGQRQPLPNLGQQSTGFTPHFYSPQEKEQQKLQNLDAEEQIKMKYFEKQEELQKQTSIAVEKARAEGRQYKSPAGPKPGGMPWETGQQIVQDGVVTFVPTTPPKDVNEAHQMAESLARTNGNSVLENYDSIWTMKAQGLGLAQIEKQLKNANLQSEITDRDTKTSREGYVLKQDSTGREVWIKKPEVAAPPPPAAAQPTNSLTPPPTRPGATPPAPPAPPVIDTGVQGKMPKGKAAGTGGQKPASRAELTSIETKKNDKLFRLHQKAVSDAAKATDQKTRDAVWAEEKSAQAQIQKDYQAERATAMGTAGGGMTPPPTNGKPKKIATSEMIKAFAKAHSISEEQAKTQAQGEGYIVQ
jgi:hypothetical protein